MIKLNSARSIIVGLIVAPALCALPPLSAQPKTITVLASNLVFPEGPTISKDGNTLFCVNVHAGFLTKVDLRTKTATREWVTLPNNGKGNGSTLGPDGMLYIADVGAKSIDRVDPITGAVSTYVNKDDTGAALHGPNDLVFDTHGGLYFTDPDGSWGNPIGGVYYVTPKDHRVIKVAGGLMYPNGVVVSRDSKTLYIAMSVAKEVWAYSIPKGGFTGPTAGRLFAKVGVNGVPDGMRLGPDGFLYVAQMGDGVISKVDSAGHIVKQIVDPQGTDNTNFCFSKDKKSLFVTETKTNTLIQLPL